MSTPARQRLIRITRRAALGLSSGLLIILVIVWIASAFVSLDHGWSRADGGAEIIRCAGGAITFEQMNPTPMTTLTVRAPRWQFSSHTGLHWLPRYRTVPLGGFASHATLVIPLWLPVLPLAILIAGALYGWHIGSAPGHCSSCGYALAGLPKPTCPECGAAAEPE